MTVQTTMKTSAAGSCPGVGWRSPPQKMSSASQLKAKFGFARAGQLQTSTTVVVDGPPPWSQKQTGGGKKGNSSGSRWEANHHHHHQPKSVGFSLGDDVDENRGFVPSEVKKDKNQREFLTNLSKRIFSNPVTRQQAKKRSSSAGRNGNQEGGFGAFQRGRTFQSRFSRETQQEQQHYSQSASFAHNPMLEKALRPASNEDYDSNSLKRRNPRQMFTDSSFYSPKHHPSVAEQVEMAHRLSSSLYDDGNKKSKGQEMYMKRAKKSGDDTDLEDSLPQHDKVPNLKLVMNPEGKLHDWTDLPEEEVPELHQMATGSNPETAHAMVENLQNCKGRGKASWFSREAQNLPTRVSHQLSIQTAAVAKTFPSSGPFQSSFKQVFNDRRGVFEQQQQHFFGDPCQQQQQPPQNPPLSRSRTVPNMCHDEPNHSPVAPPRKAKAKMRIFQQSEEEKNKRNMMNWRPLREFF